MRFSSTKPCYWLLEVQAIGGKALHTSSFRTAGITITAITSISGTFPTGSLTPSQTMHPASDWPLPPVPAVRQAVSDLVALGRAATRWPRSSQPWRQKRRSHVAMCQDMHRSKVAIEHNGGLAGFQRKTRGRRVEYLGMQKLRGNTGQSFWPQNFQFNILKPRPMSPINIWATVKINCWCLVQKCRLSLFGGPYRFTVFRSNQH